jgi:hypothetical protein
MPKKLAKRPRSSSYQEESCPEVSPPCGGTPDETECLKMHSPEIHTTREIVNYSMEDPLNVVHLRNKACHNLVKERGTDERFWTFFHQDWYQAVLYPKTSLVVKQQYVDIEYMRNKKDMHFNKILEAYDLHVSLICSSLGTTRIKKSSLSSTPLSSMTRKRGSLCG